ncbi:hypothetical protein QF028_002451 [Neobacillus sp. B4I6]|jgi:hypothetical protein
MEQVCKICGNRNEDNEKDTELSVLILCESCLKSDNFYSLLDQIFLNFN